MRSGFIALAFVAAAAFGAAVSPARAGGTVTAFPLAVTGGASPDGNGVYDGYTKFKEPCLDDSSRVGFYADLTSTVGGTTDDEVLVRARPGEPSVQLAREGEALPDATGFFGHLSLPPQMYCMNNAGRFVFYTDLTGTPGGTGDNYGLFSTAGPGTLVKHARRGDPAAGTTYTFGGMSYPTVNDEMPASVVFYATLGPTGSGGTALYHERGGALTKFAVIGQPAPDGNGSFVWYNAMALRPNAAEVVLGLHLSGTTAGALDDDGVFRNVPGALAVTQLARGNSAAPGGGLYGEQQPPVYNILGNAAFVSGRIPTSDGEIVVVVGDGADDRIAAKGQTAPDTNGVFASFSNPALSAGNLVAFKANLSGTLGGGTDDSGVFRGDGTVLVQVARENQPVPEGGGKFTDMSVTSNVVAINAAGQVLFTAALKETPLGSADDRGLYLWDQVGGLTKLLREGDILNGSTVMEFTALTQQNYGGFRVLNDAGDAVARVKVGKGFPEVTQDGIYLFRTAFPTAVGGRTVARPTLTAGPAVASTGPVRVRWNVENPAGQVMLAALDASGRLVRTLYRGADAAGDATWDGRDASGRRAAAGIYFVRLETAGAAVTRRVVWLR